MGAARRTGKDHFRFFPAVRPARPTLDPGLRSMTQLRPDMFEEAAVRLDGVSLRYDSSEEILSGIDTSTVVYQAE